MDNEALLFDKIETYLIGRMTDAERTVFEKEIAENEDLAMAVEFQRFDHDAMNALIAQNLRQKMTQWPTDIPETQSTGGVSPLVVVSKNKPQTDDKKIIFLSNRFTRYAAAASVVLGVILVGLWLNKPKNPTHVIVDNTVIDTIKNSNTTPKTGTAQTPISPTQNPKLDTQNSKPFVIQKEQNPKPETQSSKPKTQNPLPPQYNALLVYAETNMDEQALTDGGNREGNRNKNGQNADKMQAVADAYKAKKYADALILLQKMPKNEAVSEGLGLVYFRSKMYDKAASNFKLLLNETPFKERAQWHLVLCYAAQYPSKTSELNALLTAILSDEQHAYFVDAQEIKNKFF